MTIEQITEHLAVSDRLTQKQLKDLLFTIAIQSDTFLQLLEVLHHKTHRRIFNGVGGRLTTNKQKNLIGRVKYSISEKFPQSFTSQEYFIVFYVSGLSDSMFEWLQTTLNYNPNTDLVGIKKVVATQECKVCGYLGAKEICASCMTNIKSFLEYRRDSFSVPINYLNFNIRGTPQDASEFVFHYKDWLISKSTKEKVIVCSLTQELSEGYHMLQYSLPFIDYQRQIV